MEDPIETYITHAPLEVSGILRMVEQLVLEVDPELNQTLGYQMPTFKKYGRTVFQFAAQKNHLWIYPTPTGIAQCVARLAGYKTSKSGIQIPYSQPLDVELIQDLVRFKLKEVEN